MKKIFAIFAAACALVACNPVQEDFKNDGHITIDELRAKTTIVVDKAASGKNGNVITCQTSAPVNAKWKIGGKDMVGNYAWKKMKLGEHAICLEALCPDGTVLYDTTFIKCEEITNALQRFYIYGEPGSGQESFEAPNWDSNYMRFSDNEGKRFPFLTDEIYWGFKTLVFDCAAGTNATAKIMSGWWTNVNCDDQHWSEGLNELQLTEDIAKVCARGNGGTGQDLTIMITDGKAIINSVYYEE